MAKAVYRAKEPGKNEWKFGQILNYDLGNGESRVTLIEGFSIVNNEIRASFVTIDQNTLCMFTDLRDRTGNEIYEGDIVECCSWNEYFSDSSGVMKPFIRKFVVVWFNGAFMLEERYDGTILPPSHFEIHDSTDLKVIGNIFDNEDLLNRDNGTDKD